METIKNRDLFEVGTRVRSATKIDNGRRGTVVEHAKGWAGTMAVVHWDGFATPHGTYAPFEIKAVAE